MCNAFSCIITKKKKAVWKFGTDSHDELLRIAKIDDDTKDPKLIKFSRVEISPGLDKYGNRDYLNPDAKYKFKIDMDFTPDWWTEDHEKAAWLAFQKWKKQLDSILVRKPIIHPFEIDPPVITQEHIDLLKQWDSVRASVGASVGDSVRASVGASVGDSVWASVGDSVRASVRASVWASVRDSVRASVRASVGDSVWASVRDSVRDSVRASVGDSVWASVRAYAGTFFILPRSEWKYTEDIKTDEYPFQCLATLWEKGLVPSFDGKKWRLHGGKGAKILWEGELRP
jgi:hypothetical protein